MKKLVFIFIIFAGLCLTAMADDDDDDDDDDDGCHKDSDCRHHSCHTNYRPFCDRHHGHKCHCIAVPTTQKPTTIQHCSRSTECHGCPNQKVGRCYNHMCTCIVAPTTTSSTSMPTTEQTTSKRITTTSAKTTATTASAKTTTTTSTTSITTTGSPTTHSAVRMCHTCGNANNSLPCDTRTIYLGNLQSCAAGEDFCMTDIVHDGSPYPKTFKRCVSEQECRNKWLHQTSDLDYCLQYGRVPMSGQYSCHFCCVGDGCNAGQIPDKSTYYSRA